MNPGVRWVPRVLALGLFALLAVPLAVPPAGHRAPRPPRPAAYVLESGPFAGQRLYAPPPTARAQLEPGRLRWLASVPQAVWLTGGPRADAARTVARTMAAARARRALPAFVVYDIPHRDCSGSQSAGGAATAREYRRYVRSVASALRHGPAIVVLEPDGLAGLDCLSPARRTGRLMLEKWAVNRLAAVPRVAVYLDAGNRSWHPASTIAWRLVKAGVANARGFALNVSGYDSTRAEIRYGRAVSARVGWKRFVVDTSRNGRPTSGGWCNPRGAALGALPGTPAGRPGVDALLWIKRPGESDGRCGTSRAPAGRFDPTLAGSLLRNAGY